MLSVRNGTAVDDNPPPSRMTDEFDQMMKAVQKVASDAQSYPFRACTPRNILLVGRTRTGKSTISKVLQDPRHLPELGRLYAETRKICFNHLAGQHLDQFYHFNVIDSPGFYDITQNVSEKLTNETIGQFINDCIVRDVTEINVFAFVFSSKTGINTEDINSMIFMKKHYSHLQQHFILLVTHCEEKNADDRNLFVEDFFKHHTLIENDLREFFGLGVFFLGCLRPELKRNPNTNAALDQITNVLEMRKTLIDFLAGQEEKFNIHYFATKQEPLRESVKKDTCALVLVVKILLSLLIFFCLYCMIG